MYEWIIKLWNISCRRQLGNPVHHVLIECGIVDSQMDADLETAPEPSLFFGHCFSHCLFPKVFKNYYKIILDLHINWKSNPESYHIPFTQFPVILISFIT